MKTEGKAVATGQAGFDIASLWGQLPVEHLEAALKALEPQLKREHALALARLQDQKNQRAHNLRMAGLIFGFLIAVGMLVAAVLLGLNNQGWLATLMAGPSIIAIIKILVLRKSDDGDVKEAGKVVTRYLQQ